MLPVVVAVLLALSAPTFGQSSPADEARSLGPDLSAQGAAAEPPVVLRGPVDADVYIVGPGDRFRITIVGPVVETHEGIVTPEGELVLPGIAAVSVAGRDLSTIKAMLRDRVAERYSEADVSVSLVEVRRFQVNVLGAVEKPGTYVATAMEPVGALIDAAGGLADGASERNIIVTRLGGETERVDLERYTNTGDMDANPPVVDGDVVYVPFAESRVGIFGGVNRPGTYELVSGETLHDLLGVAGGLVRGALADSIEITSFADDRVSVTSHVSLADGGASRMLRDGDVVTVRVDTHWRTQKQVNLQGEVRYPGTYAITEGEDTLSALIARAGGLTDDASADLSAVIRPGIVDEVDPEFERLSAMAAGDMESTEYAYFKTMYRHSDGRVSTDFAKAISGDPDHDVLLADGDVIVVARAQNSVNVIGQVSSPGKVEYEPGKRYRHYIDEAGGFADRASRGGTRVIKGATGEWKRARTAGRLEPGDIIWVPETPERDWLEFLKDIAAIASSVATVYLVVTN